MSDESSHKTMMGLSPFSMDEEPVSSDENTPPPLTVEVEEPPKPVKPPLDPVASHIAAKRRELALKTQRLNLDELDWDIPDDKMPRATPGVAGSTPAWDESELEEEMAAAAEHEAAKNAKAAQDTENVASEQAAQIDEAISPGGDGAGTLLFSADTMNKMRAAAAAQTLEPSPLKAEQLAETPVAAAASARESDPAPSSESTDTRDDSSFPPPPVSGDSPAVSGASPASGTLKMSAGEVNAAAAAAVGMAAADVPELADDAPASSYASKGGGTEATAMPGRSVSDAGSPASASATRDSPAEAPPRASPEAGEPVAAAQELLADAAELPTAREFPMVPVAIGVTVLLVLIGIALFLLTS